MLKKITCVLAVCLIFIFSVSAAEEFFVFGKNNTEVAKTFNMTVSDLEKYCSDNGVSYLAVNTDNTKQIRKTETADEFSKDVFDLSLLSDEKILQLTDELSGFSGASGEVVEYDALKLLKTEHETEDSGGKYIITQYVTVKNAQKTVLTFYTAENVSRDYIDAVFKEQFEESKDYLPFVVIGVCVFAVLGAALLVLIFRDFKKE